MKDIITPAEENGFCEYACKEEYDPYCGNIIKCDYQGTCDYKGDKGTTYRKLVHTCSRIID